MKRAKDNISHIIAKYISWVCEEEFDATVEAPISFTRSDSYTFIKTLHDVNNYGFSFKTAQQIAPLVLGINGQDILLLEILNGAIKLTSGNKKQKIEFFSDVVVSDGLWHNLQLNYNWLSIEVRKNNYL